MHPELSLFFVLDNWLKKGKQEKIRFASFSHILLGKMCWGHLYKKNRYRNNMFVIGFSFQCNGLNSKLYWSTNVTSNMVNLIWLDVIAQFHWQMLVETRKCHLSGTRVPYIHTHTTLPFQYSTLLLFILILPVIV